MVSIKCFFFLFFKKSTSTSLDLDPLCIWRANDEILFMFTCTLSASLCLDSANRHRALLDEADVIANDYSSVLIYNKEISTNYKQLPIKQQNKVILRVPTLKLSDTDRQ